MTQESEREARAASEQRHRTANTFQLIGALARMRGQKSTDPEARRQLTWVAEAVGTLGALERHRRGAGVDLGAFLQEMAPNWRRRQGPSAPGLHLEVQPILVPDSAATSLALIAQELVGNALSHGFADGREGTVTLRLAEVEPGRAELVVRDDGKGFDPAGEGGAERFGLWFVRSLAAQVRGEFVLEQRLGVVARLRFDAERS
jgi:two-component sensor histidine kinase